MRAVVAGGLIVAVLCLIGAAYLREPAWRYALVGGMAGLSLFACGLVGIVAARLLAPPRRAIAAGLATGAAAALTRRVLLAWVHDRAADAPPQIRPAALAAAVFTVVGGLFALLWGCAALRRLTLEPPAAPGRPARRIWPELVLAGAAVALGLYGVSPLGQALGIRVSHWTFLGLVALALVAYAIEEGVSRLTHRNARRRGTPHRPGRRPTGQR